MQQRDPWAEFRTTPAAAPPAARGGFTPVIPRSATPETPEQIRSRSLADRRTEQQIAQGEREDARGGLTAQQVNELRSRYSGLRGFEDAINEIETLYQNNLQGSQGGVLGFGGDRNLRARLPLAPTGYGTLDSVSGRLIGPIMQMNGTTGGEANSMAEINARFGPYMPSSTDSDEQIESKIAGLRRALENSRADITAQLQAAGIDVGGQPAQASQAPAPRQAEPIGGRVTTAGQRDGVALSHGDEAIDENALRISAEINRRANELLLGGGNDAQVREFGRANNLDPASVEEVLRYRRTPEFRRWRQQNPDQGFRLIGNNNRELGAVEGTVAQMAASPAGSYAINAGNAVVPLPLIAAATGGNPDDVRAGIAMSREENPLSSFGGTLTGAGLTYAGGAGIASKIGQAFGSGSRAGSFLAPAEAAILGPRALAGDALYGAVQGAGENGDPLGGAVVSAVGGVAGRGIPRGIASTVSPTGGSAAGLYDDIGDMTLGQRVRGNPLGAAYNLIEEASQGVPLLGSMVSSARQGARSRWRDARWRQTLRYVDDPSTGSPLQLPDGLSPTEQQAFAKQAFDDAYDRIRTQLSFRPDGRWSRDVGQIQRSRSRLASDDQRRFDSLFEDAIARRLRHNGNQLAGQEFSGAANDISRAMRELDPRNTELMAVLHDLDNALHDGARRHSPRAAVRALNRADTGYAHLVTIQNAARRRLGNADADPADFGPSDILQATRNQGLRGNRFLRGQTPFYREAQQGRRLEDVLPSSGTSERTAAMNLGNGQLAQLGTLGAGATAASAAGADPYQIGGVTAIPILANTPGIRGLIGRALTPRGGRMATVADFIRGRPAQVGGMLGALEAYRLADDAPGYGY